MVCDITAQTGSPFEKINTNNGLPTNYIFCVAEDANGYIWAGSDEGLLLYNGYGWQVFDTDDGLPGNYINNIIGDNNGGLWLSISELGLFWFDTKTKLTYKVNFPKKFKDLNIIGQIIDDKNRLLIKGTLKKSDSAFLFITDKENKSNCTFLSAEYLRKTLPNEVFQSYPLQNKKTNIYILNDKIIKTNYDDNYNFIIQKINKDNYDFRITDFLGSNKDYLVGYNFLIKKNETGIQLLTSKKIFERKRKQCTIINNGKKVFVAKLGEGICIIDSIGNITKYSTKNGLSSDDVNNIFVAKDGTIYISTLGGGINVLKYNNRIIYEIGNAPTRNLQLYNNEFYASIGANIFALNQNKITAKYKLIKEPLSFLIQKDYLYTGNFDGIQKQQLKEIDNYSNQSIIYTAGISSILPNQNNLIVSTYGSGIYSINNFNDSKSFDHFPFDNIERCLEISKGFAALSNEKGFYIVDKNLKLTNYFNQKNGLLNNSVYYIHEFKDTLWVGGKNGVSTLVNNKVVNTYSFSKGFSGTNAIYLFTDRVGTHWVLSNSSLHKVGKDSLQAIGSVSVLLNNNDEATCGVYNYNENNLAVGTKSGICIIDLNSITLKQTINTASLYQVKVNNKNVELKASYNLPFDYKQITFYFTNINGLFKRNKILYKLENYNTDWIPLMDSLSITFDQLRPGTYKLFAKTINSNSIASENILLTTIIIKQPIWLSGWMLLLYSLAIAALIYWITISIDKRKFRKKLQALEMQQQLENERQRISRDLHDNMGAYTSALIANVDKLKQNKIADEELNKMKTNAEQILSSLRETIWVLNNKEISIEDFSDAFTTYCFKVLKNFEHINFEVEEKIEKNVILTASDAFHINKILQELLQNCIKHSKCTLIQYRIVSNHQICIIIIDNGIGYDNAKKHFGNGYENIAWRAKESQVSFSIVSHKNEGTEVKIVK